ncbi:MAG: YitT family protein, partial [Chloroflexota bacterium]|nr:YitT family protein [Chloroflexota bacterium]
MKTHWPAIRDYVIIIIAALIQALSLRLFFVPANLASGGVSGMSQLINHFTGWPIGLMVLLGNAPLFVLGWRFLGGYRFAARTALAIFMYSAFTDLLVQTPLFAPNGPGTRLVNDLQGDIFLSALYGAVVSGIGYGLVYRARGT